MRHLLFDYSFRAVGQGLFATGALSRSDRKDCFYWIFDCGTHSKQKYLQREIASFRFTLRKSSIDLFCLSHFDEDHINGARDLLGLQRVEVLAIPYFPLIERLQIALETPNLSENYLRYLVDPAGYMFAAAGDNLGEVIMIAGGPEPPEQGEEPIPNDNDDDPLDLHPPDTKMREPPPNEDLHGVSPSDSWRPVRVYTHEKPFKVGRQWEFMFFNEHVPSADLAGLRKQVVELLRKFRRDDGSFDGVELLRELKPIYAAQFGSSGPSKNKISLVTYSGPIGSSSIDHSCIGASLFPIASQRSFPHYHCFARGEPPLKVAVTYFGDFPLDDEDRLQAIQRHFQRWRWSRIDVIQIPHHGSRRSWFKGAAAGFSNGVSIISSRRVSKKHPSEMVLDDLNTHGVMLVNERQGAALSGHINFR